MSSALVPSHDLSDPRRMRGMQAVPGRSRPLVRVQAKSRKVSLFLGQKVSWNLADWWSSKRRLQAQAYESDNV